MVAVPLREPECRVAADVINHASHIADQALARTDHREPVGRTSHDELGLGSD